MNLTSLAVEAHIRSWQKANLVADGETLALDAHADDDTGSLMAEGEGWYVGTGWLEAVLVGLKVHEVGAAEAGA
jgi:hypothetical protein